MADLLGVVRRLLWFVVGLAIAAVWLVPSARAETCTLTTCTQAATVTTTADYWVKKVSSTWGTFYGRDAATVCPKIPSPCGPGIVNPSNSNYCQAKNPSSFAMCGSTGLSNYEITNAGWYGCDTGETHTGSTCVATTCPSTGGWTLSGTTCSRPACSAGQARDPTTGACKTSCDGDKIDQYTGRSIVGGMAYTKGMQFCVEGCRYFAEGIGSKAGVVSGAVLAGGTGQACDAAHIGTGTSTTGEPAATQADSEAAKCIKAGQEYGTVSGVVVCTGPMNTKETSKKVTDSKVNPDATTASTTREETTVCKDGKCTVDVKITNAGGGTGTGTGTAADGSTCTSGTNGVTTCTKTQDKPSYCAEHPDDPQCKEQGTFGGSCGPGAEPTCTGDAIQCAQARAAWKIECELTEEPTDAQYTLGKSLATGGSDPVVSPLDPSKVTTTDVASMVSTAASARTLTASCIPNQTFTVLGHSFAFDTTAFCSFASMIGYLMVAASSVIAIRMVVSGGSV